MHNFLSTSRWYQCVSVRHLFTTYHPTHPILQVYMGKDPVAKPTPFPADPLIIYQS